MTIQQKYIALFYRWENLYTSVCRIRRKYFNEYIFSSINKLEYENIGTVIQKNIYNQDNNYIKSKIKILDKSIFMMIETKMNYISSNLEKLNISLENEFPKQQEIISGMFNKLQSLFQHLQYIKNDLKIHYAILKYEEIEV